MSEQLELPVKAVDSEGGAVDILLTPAWFGLKQQIFHLAQFGGSVQVICGPKGSGKTTFLNVLSQDADNQNFVALYGASTESLNALLGSLLNELGSRIDANASLGELIAALRGYVQNLEKESSRAVVAIDDADCLDDSSLAALLSVLQGSQNSGFGLHLVLLGQTGLAERIDQLQLLDISVSDAYLPNFSPSELKTLLHESAQTHRLKSVLPVEQVQKVWAQSGGLPGLALTIADQMVGEQNNPKAIWASVGWPYSHLSALAVLIAILVWAVLVRDDSEPPSQHADDQSAFVPMERMHEEEAVDGEPLVLVGRDETQPVSTQASVPVKGPSNSNSDTLEAITARSPSEVDFGSNLEEISTESRKSDQSSIVTSLYSENVAQPEDESHDVVAETRNEGKDHEAEDASAPVVSKPVSKTPESSVANDKENLSFNKSLSRVERGEQKLQELPASSYVLQLMATSALDALVDYIDRQPNRENLMIYQGLRKGRRLYILVEGFYTDKPAASAAIVNLPTKQQRGGPWPKKVAEIHREIQQYRAN